jgi:hypothetical protein
VFSPNSKRLAFAAKKDQRWCVVVDGVDGKDYSSCYVPVFSSDSKRVAYAATEGHKQLMVIDEQEQKQYDSIALGYSFSPDSKRFAYPAKENNTWVVVLDSKESKRYDVILSKIVFESPNTFHYLAVKNDVVYLVSYATK